MITEFNLRGLTMPNSLTCETDREAIFWPKSTLTRERFAALFKWAKSDDEFFKMDWRAVVQHDGFYQDGTPINPVCIEIKEKQ